MAEVTIISFSPTSSSQLVAQTIGKVFAKDAQQIDLTAPSFKPVPVEAPLAVIAVPVYGGRVPALALERLRQLQTVGTKAITVVVYGNRAYEDALLELNDEVTALGCEVVASAAVVAEHSVVSALAPARPSELDLNNLQAFARVVQYKMASGQTPKIEVPGNRPYRSVNKAPVTPIVSDACVGCRLCAQQCPTQAISFENPKQTDAERCILCVRCVKVCPTKARQLPEAFVEAMTKRLAPFAEITRENEFFC